MNDITIPVAFLQDVIQCRRSLSKNPAPAVLIVDAAPIPVTDVRLIALDGTTFGKPLGTQLDVGIPSSFM